MNNINKARIIIGDNRKSLKQLETGSVQTCVTSPPYWALRDYGTATWIGGNENCEHIKDSTKTKTFGNDDFNKNRPSRQETKTAGYFYDSICELCGAVKEDNQIGLEQTPNDYVEQLCQVFDEVWRVLSDDGTLWLNLGDSYKPSGNSSTKKGLNERTFGKTFKSDKQSSDQGHLDRSGFTSDGVKPKDLVGIPWRVAFALQARGWYLRSEIIWHKPNPMPESVTDRPTKSHEHIFLLSKSSKYFYDHEAIKEDAIWSSDERNGKGRITYDGKRTGETGKGQEAFVAITEKRNKRDVWTIPTKPFSGAHFAVYPAALITPCVLAGSRIGDTVLDPFSGSGTTGIVAIQNARNYIGTELNPEYAALSEKRIIDEVGFLGEVTLENMESKIVIQDN
jgi:DNA modification methylase